MSIENSDGNIVIEAFLDYITSLKTNEVIKTSSNRSVVKTRSGFKIESNEDVKDLAKRVKYIVSQAGFVKFVGNEDLNKKGRSTNR